MLGVSVLNLIRWSVTKMLAKPCCTKMYRPLQTVFQVQKDEGIYDISIHFILQCRYIRYYPDVTKQNKMLIPSDKVKNKVKICDFKRFITL